MSEDASDPCFSDDEERALSAVLDEIIPPSSDGRLPGAGELGLAHYIEQTQRRNPDLTPMIKQGLAAIDDLACSRSPQGFSALSKQDRLEVLNDLRSTQPGFFPSLIFHTYVGYYQNTRVVEALGLEPRPPFPKGYEMEANDLTLLDGVRQRPKLYRA